MASPSLSRTACITFPLPGYIAPRAGASRGRRRSLPWHDPLSPELVDAHLRKISLALLRAKNVVVMTGAGISTACGIPDFRSMNSGIYELSEDQCDGPEPSISARILKEHIKGGGEAKDLFHYEHVFENSTTYSQHLRFIAALYEETTAAEPSATHKFVGEALAKNGKLTRWLTQNIDNIEVRSAEHIFKLKERRCGANPRNIGSLVTQLHGSVNELICCTCRAACPVNLSRLQLMKKGKIENCMECASHQSQRVTPPRKSVTVPAPYLRPAIVLYAEPPAQADVSGLYHPAPSECYESFEKDPLVTGAEECSSIDILLVMGTSLQIPGFVKLVRKISGKVRRAGGLVVMVNKEDRVSGASWRAVFDYQVLGATDDWCRRVIQDWESRRSSKKHRRLSVPAETLPTSQSTEVNICSPPRQQDCQRNSHEQEGDVGNTPDLTRSPAQAKDRALEQLARIPDTWQGWAAISHLLDATTFAENDGVLTALNATPEPPAAQVISPPHSLASSEASEDVDMLASDRESEKLPSPRRNSCCIDSPPGAPELGISKPSHASPVERPVDRPHKRPLSTHPFTTSLPDGLELELELEELDLGIAVQPLIPMPTEPLRKRGRGRPQNNTTSAAWAKGSRERPRKSVAT